MSVDEHHNPVEIPRSGVVYGDIIYWTTIAGAFLAIAGSIVTFVTTDNYIDPNYLLSSIWEGKGVEAIWGGAEGVGVPPDGHWYLDQITTGNGLTMFGLVLGVFSVIPGLLGASWILLTREGLPLYAGLALVAALITLFAMIA
jgi:hypothetical protein